MKDNSGAYAVFTEQGSSASQMIAAKVVQDYQVHKFIPCLMDKQPTKYQLTPK